MKIIVRNSDGLVLYAGESLTLGLPPVPLSPAGTLPPEPNAPPLPPPELPEGAEPPPPAPPPKERASNGDWIDYTTTTANATLVEGVDLPEKFTGGAYQFTGGEFVVFDQALIDAAFPPPPVPASITSRQARLVLLQYGLLANVPVAIAALPSPQKEAAQIEWEYATTLQRASPLLVGLADALGWPAETVDEIFRVGKAL